MRVLRLVMALSAGTMLMIVAPAKAQDGARFRCGTAATRPCVAPDNFRFATISAGYTHTCALTRDGVAWCWGDGRKGALGDSSSTVQRFPQRVRTETRFVEIAAGGNFTCARTSTGAIWCWGAERTVPGWPNAAHVPARVATPVVAAAVTAGRRHACVLDAQGRASCWGFNVDAETGTGTAGIDGAMIPTPTPVAGGHIFRSLTAGSGFTCGLTHENAILCWGSNIDGVVGEGATDLCGDVAAVACAVVPVRVVLDQRVVSISAGSSHVCILTQESRVLCWGSNAVGQLGWYDPRNPIVRTPRPITFEGDVRITALHSGGMQSCGVNDRSQLYCWGADSKILTDLPHWAHQLGSRLVGDGARVSAVSVGQSHFCALDTAGRPRCWGDTMLGALGNR